ncbi:subtilisin-like protease [Triticum aestivum]|uniref:subtilisin-like protease n=1 Tax=Triticum aestivum TaxID=4565 RepID=UPI001D025211|nr:subtilisin-like protease [Triticum aestivum]
MATPHVSGLMALLKRVSADDDSLHPRQQRGAHPAALYATGVGHVDLARAMDPGLAYGIDKAQYIGYLCSNLGEMAMRPVSRNSSGLCSDHEGVPQEQLNYPSIVVTLFQQQQLVVRTLTNLQTGGVQGGGGHAQFGVGRRGTRRAHFHVAETEAVLLHLSRPDTQVILFIGMQL